MDSTYDGINSSRDPRRLAQDLLVALGAQRQDIPIVFDAVEDTSLAFAIVSAIDSLFPRSLAAAILELPPIGSSEVKVDSRFAKPMPLNMQNLLVSYQKACLGRVTVSLDQELKVVSVQNKEGIVWHSSGRTYVGERFELLSQKIRKHDISAFLMEHKDFPSVFRSLREYGKSVMDVDKPSAAMVAMSKRVNKKLLDDVKTYVKIQFSMEDRCQQIRTLRSLRSANKDYSKIPFFASSSDVSAAHCELLYLAFLVSNKGGFTTIASLNNRLKNLSFSTEKQTFSLSDDPRFAETGTGEENGNSILLMDSFDATENNRRNAAIKFQCEEKMLSNVAVQSAAAISFLENVQKGGVMVGYFGRTERAEVMASSYRAISSYLANCDWITDVFPGPLPHNGYFFIFKGYGEPMKKKALKIQLYLPIHRAHLASLHRYLYELTGKDFEVSPSIGSETFGSLSITLDFSSKRSDVVSDEDKNFSFYTQPTDDVTSPYYQPEGVVLDNLTREMIAKFNQPCENENPFFLAKRVTRRRLPRPNKKLVNSFGDQEEESQDDVGKGEESEEASEPE